MTIRDEINKKKRKAAIIMYSGFIFFILGCLLSIHNSFIVPFTFFGLLLAFLGIELYLTGIRCPQCRGNLGYSVYSGNPFILSSKIRFCPFCAVALDSTIDNSLKRKEVADIIESFISQTGGDRDWDDFICVRLKDPELEEIRKKCADLPNKYPPRENKGYCSPEGMEVLRDMARELRNKNQFNLITRNKYLNERTEFLKCPNCTLVLLGVPDCHIAFYDPSNITMTVAYNLPRHICCPKCKSTWYKPGMDRWELREATIEEVRNSNWN